MKNLSKLLLLSVLMLACNLSFAQQQFEPLDLSTVPASLEEKMQYMSDATQTITTNAVSAVSAVVTDVSNNAPQYISDYIAEIMPRNQVIQVNHSGRSTLNVNVNLENALAIPRNLYWSPPPKIKID